MRGALYWLPRILGIAFAAFVSIFALDALDSSGGPAHSAAGLLAHLIPTAIVVVSLVFAWRRDWIGAVVFPLLAVVHLAMIWGRMHWSAYVAIEAPLLLLGVLFWISGRRMSGAASLQK